jgi:polyvinyl alcohol dehydrogenase (cytochrome)
MKNNKYQFVTTVFMCLFLTSCTDTANEESAGQTSTEAEESKPVETSHPGEALYAANCASCHDEAMYKAPSRLFVGMIGPENILNALNDGIMADQASDIDADGRRAIAEYLSGQSLDSRVEVLQAPACDADHAFDVSKVPISTGWGVDLKNTRFQPEATGGLSVTNVAKLEVKWAFAYPNAFKARSQPVVAGGAVYFGSQNGTVRALDAKTGCLRWSFRASAEVRTAIVISSWSADDENVDPTLYFGDLLARAYAISARTGELRWKTKVDDHRDATMTGTPTLVGDRLFVPVSSLEVVSALDPAYSCCTFRGSVVALNAATGQQIWKTYTIDKLPGPSGTTSAGTTILAPSGAPIWNSPTIDLKRKRLYVGTGENYASPADGNSDAIIAYDMETGAKLWVSQQTSGDAWNTGCLTEFTTDDANCPEENGPDYDFGSSSILVTLADGRDMVIAGQKSGAVMAIDPDNGETLWKTQVGRGGVQGGIHFGMAANGTQIYVPINDMFYPEDLTRYNYTTAAKPGLYRLNAENGEIVWSTPAPDVCNELMDCDAGISQAISAIPGAVIAGHMDGRLRVYDAENGKILWELNTLRQFDTVSGAKANGGSFSGDGGAVADGMFYINSGYGIYNHIPGNVLLALGPAEAP